MNSFQWSEPWTDLRKPRGCRAALRPALCAALFVATLTALAGAQSSSALDGHVSDPSGAAVANASVTLRDNATGLTRATKTSVQGFYEFLQVSPGNYRLSASAPGFAQYDLAHVDLLVSVPSTADLRLQLATSTVRVEINDTALPLINTIDATLGNALEQQQIATADWFRSLVPT